MKTNHLIPHQSVLCHDPRNCKIWMLRIYCWEIRLEAQCSVLRCEPWSRRREARQWEHGQNLSGPVSVLLHDYRFKIKVGLPTCTDQREAWSHSVLGDPRRGWRSVWVSASPSHRTYSIPIQLLSTSFVWGGSWFDAWVVGSSFEMIYFPLGDWPVMAVFPLADLGSHGTTTLNQLPLLSINMWKWWVALWLPL